MFTVIFYDLGLGKDGQIEQLSAFSSGGENFSAIIKTTVRANTSPKLKNLPPMLYNALASEPKDAMRRFIKWIDMICGDADMRNVVLTAHFGSCHDHVYLLRTMMGWGIKPPELRLGDSLALFKLTEGHDQQADIVSLVAKYPPCSVPYTANDADSDARALRVVVMTEFRNMNRDCYTFSISCEDFLDRTGLNMHGISPLTYSGGNSPFHLDGATVCEESGDIIRIR